MFLGHSVLGTGVSVDTRKVAAVRNWMTPPSNVELSQFVGLCKYYRPFVDGNAEFHPHFPGWVVRTHPGTRARSIRNNRDSTP